MSLRQFVGLFSLPIPFIAAYMLGFESENPNNYQFFSPRFLSTYIAYLWSLASLVVKLSMIFEKKWIKLNAISSVLWMIFMFLIFMPNEISEPVRAYTTGQNIAGVSFIFGWCIIDLADKFYMLRHTE